MPHFICTTCGTQFAESAQPPAGCPICQDERQFVRWEGQAWTTLDALRAGHRIAWKREAPGLEGIGIEPAFAMVGAIAISHPHYYSAMVEWSRAFGGVPVYVHAADRRWVMRADSALRLWEGETLELGPDLTLVRCGGHFDGATVLHWAGGSGGHGALLVGDVLQVAQDRRHVSFMYSYPNYIPVGVPAFRHIVAALEPYRYEQIFGAWWGRNILAGAREAVARSTARYLAHIS